MDRGEGGGAKAMRVRGSSARWWVRQLGLGERVISLPQICVQKIPVRSETATFGICLERKARCRVRHLVLGERGTTQFENNYFTGMCSGSEAGSY